MNNIKVDGIALLKPTAVDAAIAVTIICLFLTHTIWALISSEEIPNSFWYIVPQTSTDTAVSSETNVRTRNIQTEIIDRKLQMVIFWGSQSGRAEMLARRFAKSLHDRFNLQVLAADLSDYDHQHLVEVRNKIPVAFFLSTYGDGDPPDNTNSFWTTIQELQRNGTRLSNLRYFIFGLGNSNYRLFNRVARQIDESLQNIGAVRCGSPGQGDDADGSTEHSFLEWRPICEGIIQKELRLEEQEALYRPAILVSEQSEGGNVYRGEPHHPMSAMSNRQHDSAIRPFGISKIKKMWEDGERSCLHFEIDLGSDRSTKYKTGDHFAVWPANSSNQVDRLLSALQLQGNNAHMPVSIKPVDEAGAGKLTVPSPTTTDAVLRYYLEIAGRVSPETVADLTYFTSEESVRKEILRITADLDVFQSEVTGPYLTLADVLDKLSPQGGWSLPLSFLIERLKPMQPRLYSIASSPMVHPQQVTLCLVDNGGHGVATSYIHGHWAAANCLSGDHQPKHVLNVQGTLEDGNIYGQIQRSPFKPPFRSSTPIVMVGAGTGVAPFRGFLEERVRQGELGHEIGQSLLFMGFRHPDVDFSYREDWENWQKVLGAETFQYWTAFSRFDAVKKVYVQDRIRENMKLLMELLMGPSRCRMFICGSASMARDVVHTLREIKMAHSACDESDAVSWIKQLRQSKQLIEECWG